MKKKIISAFLMAVCFVSAFRLASFNKKEDTLKMSVASTTVHPGDNIEVTALFNDGKITPEYTIISGSRYITFNGNVATISNNAGNEEEITFYCTYNGLTSSFIKLTVSSTAQVVTVQLSSNRLIPGGEASIVGKLNGEVNTSITYELKENYSFASIENGKLKIAADAPVNSLGYVVGKYNDTKSSEVVFQVVADTSENLSFALNEESITVDGQVELGYKIYDAEGREITDCSSYLTAIQVVDTSGLVEKEVKNGSIKLTAKKHGSGLIGVVFSGGANTITETVAVNAIKTPTSISAPANVEATSYTFGLYKANGTSDKLSFKPVIVGTDVCKDYTVTFKQNNEVSNKATYNSDDNTITFTEAGVYDVIVKSNSGSANEVTLTKKITVNDGKNVTTFEDFRALTNNIDTQDKVNYKVTKINVLNDLVIDSNRYRTATEIANISINAYGSFDIKGNGYCIDASELKIVSWQERAAENIDSFNSLIDFNPYCETAFTGGKYVVNYTGTCHNFTVDIDSLDFKSNISTATAPQDILGLPEGTTPEQAVAFFGTLTNDQKDMMSCNSFKQAVSISGYSSYDPNSNKANGLKGYCDECNINNCSFYGFTVSPFAADYVKECNITDCIFEGSFASEVDIKFSNVVITDTKFKQCGMFALSYRSLAQVIESQYVLPVFEHYKDTPQANITPAMYLPFTQGLKCVNCEFDNWSDGTSLNQSMGTNIVSGLNSIYSAAAGINPQSVQYASKVNKDNTYNLILLSDRITTYLIEVYAKLQAQEEPTIRFEDSNGNQTNINLPGYTVAQFLTAGASVTAEAAANAQAIDVFNYNLNVQNPLTANANAYIIVGTHK